MNYLERAALSYCSIGTSPYGDDMDSEDEGEQLPYGKTFLAHVCGRMRKVRKTITYLQLNPEEF